MSDIYSDIYDAAANSEARAVNAEALHLIRTRLRPEPVVGVPGMRLYCAHSGSGLSRLPAFGGATPYWAYAWAGGLALARYIHDRPETVAQRRVIDFGAGSGLVAIAAALAGAACVVAVETDAFARVAIAANAAQNGVAIDVMRAMPRTTPEIDLVVAGDVFYAQRVGRRSLDILDRWGAAGVSVLIGDPYRAHLPRARLRCLHEYLVPDVGSGAQQTPSGVFTLPPKAAADPGTPTSSSNRS